MEGVNSLANCIIKSADTQLALNNNSTLANISDFEFDPTSFQLLDNKQSYEFMADLIKDRTMAEDTKDILLGVCSNVHKSYFKGILANWILKNSEVNGQFHFKYQAFKQLDMEFSPSREATIELLLDNYVDKKVEKMKKSYELMIDNTFDDLEAEVRGRWLKENTELNEQVKNLTKLNQQLRKMMIKNKKVQQLLKFYKRELTKIADSSENLLNYICFRGRYCRGKLIGLINVLDNKINKLLKGNKDALQESTITEQEEDPMTPWYIQTEKLINENKVWRKLYGKLNLQLQWKIIQAATLEIKNREMDKRESDDRWSCLYI